MKVPKVRATPGNVFVFGPSQRLVPGITIDNSREITIQDVTLHNSGGMGVIAQRSGDILVDRLTVTPSQGPRWNIVSKDSLITLDEAEVKSALRLNSIYTRVELDRPIPQEVKVNDVLADSAHYPKVLLRGCTIRGNRARGM